MSWNFRICKETKTYGDVVEVSHTIREVYYNDDGDVWLVSEECAKPGTWDEPIDGENPMVNLASTLEKINAAMNKPMLNLDTLVFANQDARSKKTTKFCDVCEETNLILLRSQNAKICPSCSNEMQWNLDQNQKPLL